MQTVESPSCFGGRCTKANFLFSPTWHGLSLQFQQRAPSQRESSVWLGTLWLLRGPAWRHPRWSSWSPLRPTFGCFDSMEARSRFVLKMAFWILTKIYKWYYINSCLRFTWSDQFHNEFDFCCCLGWFTLQKCRISTFWILEFLEKGGLYVLLATRPSSKIFRVGYK